MKIRFLMMVMAFVYVLTMMAVPAAAYSNVDVLQDCNPYLRGNEIPSSIHDLGEVDYIGEFKIKSYTNTNYYFKANDEGKIYYRISGTSKSDSKCTVETWCKTCDKKIAWFNFYPSECPCNREVTVVSPHTTHNIYFKIIASRLPEEISLSHFSGDILVSWEPTT